MDNSPYFKDYPKRSRSLICTTSKEVAGSYAKDRGIYVIFPLNGARIGLCPDGDIWQTPIDMEEFGPLFYNCSAFYRLPSALKSIGLPETYKGMLDVVNAPDYQENLDSVNVRIPAQQILPKIMEAMSPEKTGFKLYTIEEYRLVLDDRELWTDSPVVAVDYKVVPQLLELTNNS